MAEPLTRLELWKSANSGALDALHLTEPHEVATFKLTRFNQEKQHPKNWDYWQQTFDQQRNLLLALRKAKAPSADAK